MRNTNSTSSRTPTAKLLGVPAERRRRLERLQEPHISALTRFVDELRRERGVTREVPYFDPLDGGVEARALLLLEAPGAKAVESGFVSRDNPDESAKNFLIANYEAGLDRRMTVAWNIVPWYLGDGTRIRAAKIQDIREGVLHFLAGLMPLLECLECVVLVGKKAEHAERWVRAKYPALSIFRCPHPSPLFVNRAPGNWNKLVSALAAVAERFPPPGGR